MRREIVFENGEFYHLFNRSVAKTVILKDLPDFLNMFRRMEYYQLLDTQQSFHHISRQCQKKNESIDTLLTELRMTKRQKVNVIAYCLMPTHIHLLLEQLVDNGISDFLGLIQNSYARYFNTKYFRHGPLWSGRFGARHIPTAEDLFHLTRYLHLNPVTSFLVEHPEDWKFSSYQEYVGMIHAEKHICSKDIFSIPAKEYKKIVEEEIMTQRDLKNIKKQLEPW